MATKKEKSEKKPVEKAPIEATPKFVKEVPAPRHGSGMLKYLPLLTNLIEKKGQVAHLGTFKSGTATSLVYSLRETAKRTKQAKGFQFSTRRQNDGTVAVYAAYNG